MNVTFDILEPRRMLAGVTILTHGFEGNITGWIETAADAIQARAGGSNRATLYTMTVDESGGNLSVTGFGPESGQKNFLQTTDAELIIKLDWSDVSGGSYPTGDVADVVSAYLLTEHGSVPALAEMPIHLIGHSRGASLMSALSQNLGKAGVWVDHITSLDPHPVDGENDFFGVSYGDAKMASYDNVAFADDYWRTDGNANDFDFDGEPVDGAHQGNLNNSVQQDFISSAHGAVTAYYVGTIDTSTSNGGDHPVLSSWYGTNSAKPARTATGFKFSRIVGGIRPSDGISTLIGGTGSREAAGQTGSQWANGFDLTTIGTTTLSAGQTLQTSLKFVDRDSSATVFLYLDTNKNPYDGATYLTRKGFSSTTPVKARINAPTSGLSEGSYYLVGRITDAAGHTRYTYGNSTIQITTPDFANLSSGVLTVNGTDGNDAMTLTESGSTITANLNGATQNFNRADVTRIEMYGGTGNDVINASALVQVAYVNAGPGQDNVTGGSGNDTLTGGAQSNTLVGGLGDDVLNGSPGNDLMDAQGGNDRLYSNGGFDTMNGGSNVDRLFGSASNEYMIGGRSNDKMYAYGGNDTLIGGDDTDILDGGEGTDSADNDPDDIRVSIEILI